MTRAEAEAQWVKITDGLEASPEYLAMSHDRFIYDSLAGDFTPPYKPDMNHKLMFFREKLKDFRDLGDKALTDYIVEKLKEAKSGK